MVQSCKENFALQIDGQMYVHTPFIEMGGRKKEKKKKRDDAKDGCQSVMVVLLWSLCATWQCLVFLHTKDITCGCKLPSIIVDHGALSSLQATQKERRK